MTQRSAPAASRVAAVAALVVVAIVAVVAIAAGIDDDVRVLDLARDPATLSRSPVHDGLLTTLGGFAWTTAIVVALLAAWLTDDRPRRGFLLSLAAVSAVLMTDDMFLVHERLAPRIGLAEELLFLAYGAVLGVALIGGRSVVRTTAWPLLIVALTFFALGVGRNRVATIPLELLPDTWPFLGVGFWAVYVLHTGVATIEDSRVERGSHSAST